LKALIEHNEIVAAFENLDIKINECSPKDQEIFLVKDY